MASLTIVLDTRPPTLTIEAPARIEPPDDLVVLVLADEPLGPVSMALVDALGTLTQLGFERLDPRSLRLVVPTVGLATGAAKILLSVADEVLNITQESVTVHIERERAFDVELTIEHGHDVDLTLDGGYEVTLDMHHAHDADLEVY
jgi:hypothetical protein